MREAFEERLDTLREEARTKGFVSQRGVRAVGGPMPSPTSPPETLPHTGYYGLPIIKPPVWEWMIPVYFFVGGLAGMAGLIAAAALVKGLYDLARVAMWAAGIGAILSPVLLTADLGRPRRFINMLRVFKFQSPMSVGSWIVASFGACAVPGLTLVQWQAHNLGSSSIPTAVQVLIYLCVCGAGFTGIFLATYTGALIAVTAVPAWNVHRLVLPFHFGMAGLGSAAAILEMVGFRIPSLNLIGFFAASAQTLVMLWLEGRKHGSVDRALHEGQSGWTLRAGEVLEGPLALALRSVGLIFPAALAFAVGALISRFGWIQAGKSSALDPEATFAQQRVPEAGRAAQALRPGSSGNQR